MRKLTALASALAFAGITFAQPAPPPHHHHMPPPPPPHHHHHKLHHHHHHMPPPGSYQGQYPIGGKRYKEWWCSQNWEQCRQMKLMDLLGKKECLEKSQSYQAYRECEFMRKHGHRHAKPGPHAKPEPHAKPAPPPPPPHHHHHHMPPPPPPPYAK